MFNQRNHGIGSDLFNHHCNSAVIHYSYRGDGEAGGGLPPAHAAQPGLVLDDAVGDTHLPAERGQEHHQLETVYFNVGIHLFHRR